MRFMQYIESINPVRATLFSGVPILGNVLVWLEAIKGPAAAITVILGVPTGILVLIYWAVKIRNEIRAGKSQALPLTKEVKPEDSQS